MLKNNKFKAQTLTGNPTGNNRCQLLASRALNMSCSFSKSARSIESRCVALHHNHWTYKVYRAIKNSRNWWFLCQRRHRQSWLLRSTEFPVQNWPHFLRAVLCVFGVLARRPAVIGSISHTVRINGCFVGIKLMWNVLLKSYHCAILITWVCDLQSVRCNNSLHVYFASTGWIISAKVPLKQNWKKEEITNMITNNTSDITKTICIFYKLCSWAYVDYLYLGSICKCVAMT